MNKITVTCMGCGKVHEIAVSDDEPGPQEVHVDCDCGAVTDVKAPMDEKGKDKLEIINEILSKAMPIIQEFRRSKTPGVDTGIGEALAAVSKELALEIIKENPELLSALGSMIEDNLRAALLGGSEEKDSF